LSKTVVFIDYENIFWSSLNYYYTIPDINQIKELLNTISSNIDNIYIYSNFNHKYMIEEKDNLRQLSNNLITTESKKDKTDFIMIEDIHRTLRKQQDIEQLVLITGDGHFEGIINSIKNDYKKTVITIGVDITTSKMLKKLSDFYIDLIPFKNIDIDYCIYYISKNINWALNKNIIPTFEKTVNHTSSYYSIDNRHVKASMQYLLDKNYIIQRKIK